MEKIINKLVETFYISGPQEHLKFLKEELSKYTDVKTDKNFNIIATMGDTKSKKHIMLEAHLDQIGMVVTNILENGFLKVAPCGGIDCRVLPGSTLKIYGTKTISGIVCSLPPHLANNENNKFLKTDEIYIDTGLSKEKATKLIPLYSYVGFSTKPQKLLNDNLTAPGLDNRAGIATLLHCAKILSEKNLECQVSLVFSVGEETTALGAKTASFEICPQEAIAVDVSFATQPDIPFENKGILGGGPMIGFAPALSKEISGNLIKIAKKQDIPYQYEIMGGKTGTNADHISITKSGIKTGLVSIPLRYMHSPVEIINLKDIKNTAKLLASYIKKGGSF